MFRCKLCEGILSSNKEIVATLCGHIFHHDCLDYFLISRNTCCPTCGKSLRVVPSSTLLTSGFAILTLHPYEGKIGDNHVDKNGKGTGITFKNELIHENLVLRQKFKETVQTLLVPQKEKTYSFPKPGPAPAPVIHRGAGRVPKEIESDLGNANLRNLDLLAFPLKSIDGKYDGEKNSRVVRSKRRAYLTWRNKAQSWLAKMMVAGERLLKFEESFSSEEYLVHLRLFLSKVYQQGHIVEVTKQAASLYLIIGNPSDAEMKEIWYSVNQLIQDLSRLIGDLVKKLKELESSEQKSWTLHKRTMPEGAENDFSRATRMSPDDEETTSKVSSHPGSAFQSLIAYLETRENGKLDISQDPVFV